MIAVSDTGCGMDDATKRRIFEPFFTTKPAGTGTGLGLATVYGIVKQTRGYIYVDSEPHQGATFRIYLPRTPTTVAARKSAVGLAHSPRGKETVLVVEDEEAVRALTRHILQQSGYTVLAAASGEAAIRMAEAHRGGIHLLVTDVVMPHMSGRELADRLAATRPETKVLYLSGYTDDAIIRHGVQEADTVLLQKPFDPGTLARKVRQVLDHRPCVTSSA
jgi:two-component system, cell cycle sensor histidine kinase and response regulator CckA